jgi:hypothetical protein
MGVTSGQTEAILYETHKVVIKTGAVHYIRNTNVQIVMIPLTPKAADMWDSAAEGARDIWWGNTSFKTSLVLPT